ncbi:polysaccharide deacetylase [Virgibacillus phasianinus]|uniref:Polysaccharide deacetylase n=2 Tax=Virgibacillus phasianinus TaxID=2017483 RepID=A0A220U8S8_9BACI|nr:polysaccharide deacetylase [Virgibacillus phasianinus]
MSACSDNVAPVDGNHKEKKDESEQGKEKNQNKKNEETDKEKSETSVEKPTEPKYSVNQKNWSIEPIKGDTNEKVVLLTIDDAPDKYAVDMAKTLKELDAGAIFFVNGIYLDSQEGKKALKKIHDMGFLIGNHTYSHAYLPDLSEGEQRKEIEKVSEMVEQVIGEKPKFFRAPNGANTDSTRKIADEQGMILMNWSYGYDYFEPYMDAEKLTKAMVTGKAPEIDIPYSLLKPGANLLMHDREWTSKALSDIVRGLRDKGYKTVDPHLIKTK